MKKLIEREIWVQASFRGKREPTRKQMEEAAKTVLQTVEYWDNGKRILTLEELEKVSER